MYKILFCDGTVTKIKKIFLKSFLKVYGRKVYGYIKVA